MPYYRKKFSKRIKSTLYKLFFLKYRLHVSSLSSNEHIQKFAHAYIVSNTYIFQVMSFKIYAFSHKKSILGKYLCVSHSLFILFLEAQGNHTLVISRKLNLNLFENLAMATLSVVFLF